MKINNGAVALIIAAAALLLSDCAKSGGGRSEPQERSPSASVQSASDMSSAKQNSEKQPDKVSLDLSGSKKPAVSAAAVSGVFEDGALADIYGAEGDDRKYSEESGIFSCPVRFDCGNFRAGVVEFKYDSAKLNGTPAENLRIIYFGESGAAEYLNQTLDAQSCTVSAPADGAGVYILVDEYARRVALGEDVSGLTVPSPQDEIYDGEIPYYAESRPFTVTIPRECYSFEHIADIGGEGLSCHTFLRIAATHSAFVWVDISYITFDEPHEFRELGEILESALPTLLEVSDGSQIPTRTVTDRSFIASSDGTVGYKIEAADVYAPSGINPKLTYRTVCYYFPDKDGGCYEVRAQFLDNVYDPDRVTNSLSERILNSFTLKAGVGADNTTEMGGDKDDENLGHHGFSLIG